MTEKLLALLQAHANLHGLVMVREAALLESLSATRAELAKALDELAQARQIRLLSPLPYVALRLPPWSGKRRNPTVSYSKLLQSPIDSRSNSYSPETGGSSEGLLSELLTTLGESDPATFEGVFEHYPESVIRKAMERVRQAGRIRKSKTALFRYLLVKLSARNNDQD